MSRAGEWVSENPIGFEVSGSAISETVFNFVDPGLESLSMLKQMGRTEQLKLFKLIVDRIETYPEGSVGLRSKNNLGVWGTGYALMNEDDRRKVVTELLKKANMPAEPKQVDALKEMLDQLFSAESLTAIIKDYEAAGGTFEILVQEPDMAAFKEQAAKAGLEALVDEKHLKELKEPGQLAVQMKNTVTFFWKGRRGNSIKLQEEKIRLSLGGEEMKYFIACNSSVNVKYDAVQCKGNWFHVAQIDTLPREGEHNKSNEGSCAFLIAPVDADPKFLKRLQPDWLDIIEKFEKSSDAERYAAIQAIAFSQKNLKIRVTKSEEAWNGRIKFESLTVRFPALNGEEVKTEEERPGIYKLFVGKTIGPFFVDRIDYKGERVLKYDREGGEIKNVERFLTNLSGGIGPEPIKIDIDYSIEGLFAFVYQVGKGLDYFPFIIKPEEKGVKKFDSSKNYPSSEPFTPTSQEVKSVVTEQKNIILQKLNEALALNEPMRQLRDEQEKVCREISEVESALEEIKDKPLENKKQNVRKLEDRLRILTKQNDTIAKALKKAKEQQQKWLAEWETPPQKPGTLSAPPKLRLFDPLRSDVSKEESRPGPEICLSLGSLT